MRTGDMRRARIASTILSALVFLTIMQQSAIIASAQITESFETGFGDWVADWNYDAAYFSVSISSLYGYDGTNSVKMDVHGLPTPTYPHMSAWVERTVPVPASTTLNVSVTFQLYSEAPLGTPCEVLAYVGNTDPEDYWDFAVVGGTDQIVGWYEYSHFNEFVTDPSGQIYVAVGFFNHIVGLRGYYFDWIVIDGITIDNDPPEITNLQPLNQTTIANARPLIGADYTDASGIDTGSVVLKVDGADVSGSASITASGVTYTPSLALAEGIHDVLLEVADTAPAQNNAVKTWWFTVDTLPPVISNEQPADLSTTGDPTPAISASFTDASGVDIGTVLLEVDSIDVTSSATLTPTSISYISSALNDGAHDVYLEASDNSNPKNKGTKTWSFTVDTIPPLIDNLQPLNLSLVSSGTPLIGADYTDTSSIDIGSVRLKLDSFDITLLSTVTATGVSHIPTMPLSDGSHDVYVEVADVNSNLAKATWTFTVDATPPITALNILSPNYQDFISGRTYVTSSTPLNLTWDDGSGTGVDSVYYKYYASGEVEPAYSQYTSDFTIPSSKSDGLIIVNYQSEDSAGNEESEQTSEVYLDNTPPVTALNYGSPNYTGLADPCVTSDTPISFSSSDGDGSGVASLLYRVMKDGSVEIDWTQYVGGSIFLSGGDGTRVVLFRSTDNLDNQEAENSISIYLDNTPPDTSLQFGDPNHEKVGITYVNVDTSITFFGDDESGSGTSSTMYRIMKDGLIEIDWTQYTSGSIYLSGDDGVREVFFRSTDNLGNEETEREEIIYLDTTPPASNADSFDETSINYINNALTTIVLSADDGQGSGVDSIWYGTDDPNCPNEYSGPIVAGSMAEGQHTLYFKGEDNVGNEEGIRSIAVFLDTTAPIADAGSDIETDTDDLVTLVGSSSTDEGSGISNYTWTFVYKGSTVPLSGETAQYAFEEEGTYQVTLTVTDKAGNQASDTITVTASKSAAASVFPWWILILLLIAVVVALLLIFGIFKRKKKEPVEEEYPTCTECGHELGPHDRICPECDTPVPAAVRH